MKNNPRHASYSYTALATGTVLALVVCGATYLLWGEIGLIGLGGATVGLGLPLLLGESEAVQSHGLVGARWKWDGTPDDGGDPYGEGIFNE